jgi:hypothetical protein
MRFTFLIILIGFPALISTAFRGPYCLKQTSAIPKTADTTSYNVDGRFYADMHGLAPLEIAYVQVLDVKQSENVFGGQHPKGVIYVTSLANRKSEINTSIQQKIDVLTPNARSYYKVRSRLEENLMQAIKLADDGDWLVIIDLQPSTLEALKRLSYHDIRNLSYNGADQSQQYGAKGKNGVVHVDTKKMP